MKNICVFLLLVVINVGKFSDMALTYFLPKLEFCSCYAKHHFVSKNENSEYFVTLCGNLDVAQNKYSLKICKKSLEKFSVSTYHIFLKINDKRFSCKIRIFFL